MTRSMKTAFVRVTADNDTVRDGVVSYKSSDIENILNEWSQSAGITYWFIEHTADDGVSSTHFHIVIKFKNPAKFETVKNKFPFGMIESARNLRATVQYLIHLNDKSKKPYQWDDIKTNCVDMTPYKVQTPAQVDVTLQSVYDAIEKGEIREYNVYEKIPIALFAGNKTRIDNALLYFREKVHMTPDRDINVIFMSGESGIGKTTFAKMYCETLHQTPCISSSSNDPLQDYRGEPVLILDDLRDDSFKYHDFLKLLDNHTKSTSKSRYHNKAFIGDMIIITSTKPINEWYFNKTSEDKHQLRRRVRQWYKFDGDRIYVFEYSDRTKRYEPAGSAINPVLDEIKKKQSKLVDVFGSMGLEFNPSDRKHVDADLGNYVGLPAEPAPVLSSSSSLDVLMLKRDIQRHMKNRTVHKAIDGGFVDSFFIEYPNLRRLYSEQDILNFAVELENSNCDNVTEHRSG